MSYEAEWLSAQLLKGAGRGWAAIQARLSVLPTWVLTLLVAVALATYGSLLRCLHLLNRDHYYMLSPDSYFFHWLAGRIMTGEGAPPDAPLGAIYTLHSGLAYPLAYGAKAIGFVFGLSSPEALDVACKILPLILAVIGAAVLYWLASKATSRRVALFAAFAWAAMLHTVFIGAAGYVDRDGLSILLMVIGAFLFYLSKDWHFRMGGRDMGWLLGGLAVLAIEGILYLEWSIMGPVILLASIAAYFVVKVLIGYADRLQSERSAWRRLSGALSEAHWRAFALIVVGNMLVAAVNFSQTAYWLEFLLNVIRAQGQLSIGEMRGIGSTDLLVYYFFLIPMALGLLLAWKKRDDATIFFACWFLCLLALSLFASRVLLYAAPAACLLSGVALAFLWSSAKQGQLQRVKKLGVAVLICALFLGSLQAYSIAAGPAMTPDDDWQDTLVYLREETPQESVIMTWWDYGYWILDLGQRRPLVDNGYYGWDFARLRDVGLVYSATEPAEAARIMGEYGVDYVIFSDHDRDFAPTIMAWAHSDGEAEYDQFAQDSLVVRTLSDRFESEGGLEVVHRSSPSSTVVILGRSHESQF
jgi:asparagine N-glycosylation enzyme membrane subunit Stt3